MSDIQSLVNELVSKLRKRKVEGSRATALLTAELLRSVISQQKVPQTNQAVVLIEAVKNVGELLIAANPAELAVGNILRRILYIIREENVSLMTDDVGVLTLSSGSDDEDDSETKTYRSPSTPAKIPLSLKRLPSLHALLDHGPDSGTANIPFSKLKGERNAKIWKLKHEVLEVVNELIEDINTCHELIAEQAVEIIHQNEVILTFGRSRTVMEFVCAAKKRRSFRVYVAEGAPKYKGHVLAKDLVARGLQTTVITDSAVFAMISRVNMVIVGVHAVMANGGVIGAVGLNMVALAAKKHAVPFVVVAGTHKLSPLYPQNPGILLNEMGSPAEVLHPGEFSDCMDFGIGSGTPLLHVDNPAFDYVPPELVSLFITDTGGHNPSYIYRLIADYYSADDFILRKPTAS